MTLSAVAPLSSKANTEFTTMPLSSQQPNNTPPPPGFQAVKHTVPLQNVVDILNLGKNIRNPIRYNTSDRPMLVPSASCGKTGRVVTTVLLDKVKNPPLSLQQQNNIHLLSTLAWNCGQESKLSWSKLFQSKPSSSVTPESDKANFRSLFTNSERQSCETQNSTNNLNALMLPPCSSKKECNSPLGSLGQAVPLTSNILQTNPTFSTILMNRIEQRSHNRDYVGNVDTTCRTVCSTMSQSIFCVKDSTTSPLIETKLPLFNNAITVSSNSIHRSRDKNVYSNKLSQQLNKTETTLQSQIIDMKDRADGISNKTGHDLNSQYIGKQNGPSRNKSDSRSLSPTVLFPEQIRDTTGTSTLSGASFPAFHEVQTSDFLSEMFSDPLVTDNIAINQIRQKIVSNHSTHNTHPDTHLQASDFCDVDLDYYASLYQIKFRDVLGSPSGQNRSHLRPNSLLGNPGITRHCASAMSCNYFETLLPQRHSLRWHRSLQKILDLLWTTRRQCGDIVLPNPVPEYSIGMAGNIIIVLGFLMDGSEVAVLIVDKTFAQISPRIVDIMSNTEMDKYFLARCKSYSELANTQYIAMELYEYNLCEYLHVCLTTCNQNTTGDVYTGLVWQLLQAIGFLHHKLGVPHGYLAPSWIFINSEGHLRLAGFGITTPTDIKDENTIDSNGYPYRTTCWEAQDDGNNLSNETAKPSFLYDIRAAGKLAYLILTKGQYLFGSVEPETHLLRDHLNAEAFDFISPMLTSDPKAQLTIDQCLKHPMFWLSDKKFRLILIVGSDVLTEMKTGIALTGTGAATMVEILSLIDINMVSPNWIHEVDGTVLKEMRSFRVYKNNLAELTLFVYNCCLHFDKLSNSAKEVLDDPCKYFQNMFPNLFIAIYRSLKSSDRTERTCYKPFF